MIEIWRSWYPPNRKVPWQKRNFKAVRYLALHHTAGPATQAPSEIKAFHEKGRGWPHIGYHYLVYATGEVFKTLPLSAVPICVKGRNLEVVCIALVGDFEKEPWPPYMPGYKAAWRLAQEIVRSMPFLELKLHRELSPTQCPGRITWGLLKQYAEAP